MRWKKPHTSQCAPAQTAPKRAGRWLLRGFTKDQRGVTAVEFGLLAVPFFAIIGAILETALVMLASQILEAGVQDAGRLIRTGQAHSSGYTIAEFRTELCDQTIGLFDCSKFRISVRTVATFGTASYTPPVDPEDEDAPWLNVEQYSHGVGGSIILIDVHYKWPTVIGMMGFNLADLADNTRLLSGVAIFRNEPFG